MRWKVWRLSLHDLKERRAWTQVDAVAWKGWSVKPANQSLSALNSPRYWSGVKHFPKTSGKKQNKEASADNETWSNRRKVKSVSTNLLSMSAGCRRTRESCFFAVNHRFLFARIKVYLRPFAALKTLSSGNKNKIFIFLQTFFLFSLWRPSIAGVNALGAKDRLKSSFSSLNLVKSRLSGKQIFSRVFSLLSAVD